MLAGEFSNVIDDDEDEDDDIQRMITLMEEHSLSALDRNETWTGRKEW